MVKVSILCITYNHAPYIRDALDSFLAQVTNFPFEIVIADDASTDNNQQIIQEYVNRYPEKINAILRKQNVGVNRNWMDAFLQCTGEYIAMCEADDYWTDFYKLQKQANFLENNPGYSMAFHNTKTIDSQGKILSESYLGPKKKIDRTFKDIFLGKIPTATVMFRKDLIKEFPREFYKVINADTFLFALIAQHGDAKYIDDIKPSMYRIHDGGIWSTQSLINRQKHGINTLENLLAVINPAYRRIINHYLSVRYYGVTSSYIQHSYSLKKILLSYLKSIRLNCKAKDRGTAFLTGHKRIINSLRALTKKNK